VLAFEVAARLDAGNMKRVEQLAQVYALAGPHYVHKQIATRQRLLAADKARPESYQALQAVYAGHGLAIKATACQRALTALHGQALPFAEASTPTNERPLTEEAWSRLRHPDEDPLVSAVFVLVTPIVMISMAQRVRTPLPRERLVPPGDSRRFAQVLRRAARTLGVAVPALDVAPHQAAPAGFSLHLDENLIVPVLRIGAPMLEPAATEEELWFLAGRCAAMLRPERLLRWLLPLPQQLVHLLEAAVALARGTNPDGELGKTVAGLRHDLGPVALDQLVGLGQRLAAGERSLEERLRRWLAASDHTATRAGYLLCNDLATSLESIARGERPDHVATQERRRLELVWSSVTEDFFDVQARVAGARAS
jgi:hypothetical protein